MERRAKCDKNNRYPSLLTSIMLCSGLFAGCPITAAAPVTEEDVAKAQADAQNTRSTKHASRRVRNVKNALKQAGADSKNAYGRAGDRQLRCRHGECGWRP